MINILSILPGIGWSLAELIWCSCNVIINRIFVFHFVVGFLIGFFILLHIFLPHPFSSSNPLLNSFSSFTVSFFVIFFNDITALSMASVIVFSFLFWEPDVFGNCDNPIFANPLSTPNHTLPEWYFLIFHSCLRAYPNKTMGVIIVLIFLFLFLLSFFQYWVSFLFFF